MITVYYNAGKGRKMRLEQGIFGLSYHGTSGKNNTKRKVYVIVLESAWRAQQALST